MQTVKAGYRHYVGTPVGLLVVLFGPVNGDTVATVALACHSFKLTAKIDKYCKLRTGRPGLLYEYDHQNAKCAEATKPKHITIITTTSDIREPSEQHKHLHHLSLALDIQNFTMTTPEEVLYYVPNLIGYGRVISTIVSFLLMIAFPERWFLATWLYIFSFVGDLFDGMVARKLNQTSEFGGLLDMVTDRCSTLGLLFVLSGDYAKVDFEIGFPVYRLVRGIFA